MRRLTSMGLSSTSKPATVTEPALGGRKQVSTRMVVVLPAPLGPRKPTICPFSTSKEILSTASLRAYRLVSPSTLIIRVTQCYSGRASIAFVSLYRTLHHSGQGRGVSIGSGRVYGSVLNVSRHFRSLVARLKVRIARLTVLTARGPHGFRGTASPPS